MRSEWIATAMLCGGMLGAPALAVSTADELAQIESDHVILKARLRLLETRAQMAARQTEIERFSAGSQNSAMPTVSGIDGMSGKLHATVLTENGHVAEVQTGDTLPNGMRILSIRQDGVIVQAGKNRVRLKPGVEPESGDPAWRAPNEGTAASPASFAPAPGSLLNVMPSIPARQGPPR